MKYVFLHGLGQTNKDWYGIIDYLGQPDSLLISLNNPHQEDLSFQRVQERIYNRLNEIEEEFILIGLSLGGMIALNYARQPSPFLKALVVSGAPSKSRVTAYLSYSV